MAHRRSPPQEPPSLPAATNPPVALCPSCSDNLRGFFEQCFPTLLKRLFGYDGTSWLNLVAQVGGQCAAQPVPASGPAGGVSSVLCLGGASPAPLSLRPCINARSGRADAGPLPRRPRRAPRRLTPAPCSSCCPPPALSSPPCILPTPTAPPNSSSPRSGCPRTRRWGCRQGVVTDGAVPRTRLLTCTPAKSSPGRNKRPPPLPQGPALFPQHPPGPRPRLPQMLLAAPAGRAELERWPQYARGAVVADASGRCHVKLGVFQFFLFWFAFYVIKGDGGAGVDSQLRPQSAGLTSSVRKVGRGLGGGGVGGRRPLGSGPQVGAWVQHIPPAGRAGRGHAQERGAQHPRSCLPGALPILRLLCRPPTRCT